MNELDGLILTSGSEVVKHAGEVGLRVVEGQKNLDSRFIASFFQIGITEGSVLFPDRFDHLPDSIPLTRSLLSD